MKAHLLKIYFLSKHYGINIWYVLSKFFFITMTRNKVNQVYYADLMECALPVWYHNFANLGVKTKIIPFCGYREAQNLKDSIINDYVKIILSTKSNDKYNGFGLFCSDGYYSHYFAELGYHMLGVDLCEDSGEGRKRSNNLEHARLIQRTLDNGSMTNFQKGDVFDVHDTFDLIVNIGGLYHISNPQDLIRQNINNLNRGGYLIVQSIVADVNDPEYFCSPAPGWDWGCRFSHDWLRCELTKFNGIKILDDRLLDAKYNRSLFDRNYSSFLIKKEAHENETA